MNLKIDLDLLKSEVEKVKGDMSLGEVEQKSGVSSGTIDYILRGGGQLLPAITYVQLCHWLGVSVYYFMRDEGNNEQIGTAERYNFLTGNFLRQTPNKRL